MSVSPGILVEEVIAEEPEECLDEEEDCGAGDELCDRFTPNSADEEEQDPGSPETLRSPTTSRIPVWVRSKGEP